MEINLYDGSNQTDSTRVNRIEAQPAFLEAYARCGNIARAAKIAGICRTTHYFWVKTDPRYRESFEMLGSIVFDCLHEEAFRRAVDGVERLVFYKGEQRGSYRQYSDRLLIKLLTMFNPRKYDN